MKIYWQGVCFGALLMVAACQNSAGFENQNLQMKHSTMLGSSVVEQQTLREEGTLSVPKKQSVLSFVHKEEVRYSIKVMTALEFLEKKGEKPASKDLESLRNETVLMLDYQCKSGELEDFAKLDSEQAIRYLNKAIAANITMVQTGNKPQITGVLLEGQSLKQRKLRVLLFYKALQPNQPYQFHLEDQLFGAGNITLFSV